MKKVDLDSWEAFVEFVQQLEVSRKRFASTGYGYVPPLLYRGQADAGWGLTTTLDRTTERAWHVHDYLRLVLRCRGEIESFSKREFAWEVPSGLREHISSAFDDFQPERGLPYEYMAFLRHHGFPSPLLDWTASPYVAAFFAFRPQPSDRPRAAVYAYLAERADGRGGWLNTPMIWPLGPSIRAHPRHFMQQCQYTVCVQRLNPNGPHLFCRHDEVLADPEPEQDMTWKVSIPSAERGKAMAHLRSMNITMYTLFGSEDSLVQAIADREFA